MIRKPVRIILNYFTFFKGLPFTVKAGSLTFSVMIFTICSIVCFSVLFIRRFTKWFGRGELGGPTVPKMLTSGMFVLLWFLYITLSTLQAYDYIPNVWSLHTIWDNALAPRKIIYTTGFLSHSIFLFNLNNVFPIFSI